MPRLLDAKGRPLSRCWHFGAEQLVVHGELADLGLEPGHQLIPVVGRAALHGGGAAVQEGVTPPREGGGDDAQLPGEGVEVLAPEESEDGLGLPPCQWTRIVTRLVNPNCYEA